MSIFEYQKNIYLTSEKRKAMSFGSLHLRSKKIPNFEYKEFTDELQFDRESHLIIVAIIPCLVNFLTSLMSSKNRFHYEKQIF